MQEEATMLARKEAKLATHEQPRFMNQAFLMSFPQRTLESIKGRRKRQDHKDMVATFIADNRDQRVASPPQEDDGLDDLLSFLKRFPLQKQENSRWHNFKP